jgi:hypothetical protein
MYSALNGDEGSALMGVGGIPEECGRQCTQGLGKALN